MSMKDLSAILGAVITGLVVWLSGAPGWAGVAVAAISLEFASIRQRLDNISTLLMVTSLPAIKELMDKAGSRQV